MSFSKSEIALAEAARAISAFWKTHSCKLIPNWTRNRMITYTKRLTNLSLKKTYECIFTNLSYSIQAFIRTKNLARKKKATIGNNLKVNSDHRSKFSNLSNWKEEAWKKIRASTGFEPVTSANAGAMLNLRRLERVFRCTRAQSTHAITKRHASAESVLKSVHRKLMIRKIARTGNKTCGKHLYLARKFARWPILIFCMHASFRMALQI